MRTLSAKAPHVNLGAIKRRLSIRDLLEHFGWRIRRNRADCGLCRGSQKLTLSFNDGKGLWHCHRCQQSGDVFALWMAAHNSSFKSALERLAALAGVAAEPTTRAVVEHARRVREQVRAQAELAREARRRERLAARDSLLALRTHYRSVNARLTQLRGGKRPSSKMNRYGLPLEFDARIFAAQTLEPEPVRKRRRKRATRAEIEACWACLALLTDAIAEADAEYCRLAELD